MNYHVLSLIAVVCLYICLANAPQYSRLDAAVSQPVEAAGSSPELQKNNPVGRWLLRLVKKDQYFEIPNYPLDQQPDPEKITHIDADLRGCTGPIRDQKQCGACYAFSWISYAEWHYCAQKKGELVSFSEQHLIDCGRKARLGGCTSGYLPETMDFSQIFGFHLAKDYPYRASENSCKSEMGTIRANIDAKRINFNREDWEQLLYEQPILVQVNLPLDISQYSRGIHPGTNCDERKPHGMLLVGHGRHQGKPYWLLRNSMNSSWGENGYLRLSRDAPIKCMSTGFVAKIKFKQLDEDSYHEFYESLQHKPNLVPIYDWKKVESNL